VREREKRRESERDRERKRERAREGMCVCVKERGLCDLLANRWEANLIHLTFVGCA